MRLKLSSLHLNINSIKVIGFEVGEGGLSDTTAQTHTERRAQFKDQIGLNLTPLFKDPQINMRLF